MRMPSMMGSRAEFERWTEESRRAIARGDRLGAEVALTAAIGAADGVQGLEPARAEALLRLAAFQQEVGNLADAERLLREALATRDGSQERDDAALVSTLIALGRVLVAREDVEQARTILTRALALSDRTAHAPDESLVALLYELSRLCMKQSAYSFAEPLLQRLLAIKRAHGDDHPEVATVLASLAKVRLSLGDPEAAERLYRRALQIREKTLAPNHFAIAATLEHLAETCAARGKLDEALALLRRALSMRELTLGAAHASVRAARERIADMQLQASEESLDDLGSDEYPSANPAPPQEYLTPAPFPPEPLSAPPLQRAVDVPARPEEPLPISETAEARGPLPIVLIPWANDFKTPKHDVDDTDPLDDRSADAVSRGWIATTLESRSGKVLIVAAAVIAVAVAALAMQTRRTRSAGPQIYVDAPPRVEQVRVGAATARAGEVELPLVTKAPSVDSAPMTGAAANSPPAPAPLAAKVAPRPEPTRTSLSAPARTDKKKSTQPGRQERIPELPALIVPNVAFKGIEAPHVAELPARKITDSFPGRLATGVSDDGVLPSGNGEPSRSPSVPRLIGAVPQPKYPEQLRDRRVEGQVLIQFVVDASGRPELGSLRVMQSPHDAMTEAVRRVLPQFRFEPARTAPPESKPRAEIVRYAFNFRVP